MYAICRLTILGADRMSQSAKSEKDTCSRERGSREELSSGKLDEYAPRVIFMSFLLYKDKMLGA